MSRQIYQKSGLIAALVLAAVSLPVGIIGLTREPKVIENYYIENYYIYNNQTEQDFSKPREVNTYYNFDQYDCTLRNFTLSSDFAYWFFWNASVSFQIRYYCVRSFFYNNLIALNGTVQIYGYLENVNLMSGSKTSNEGMFFFIPPFLSDWLFLLMIADTVTVNITLTDEIVPI